MNKYCTFIVAASLVSAPAQAGRLSFEAMPQQGVSTVEWLGSPKMIQQRERGKVSVVPRGLEKGRMVFDVEVQNLSEQPTLFGQDSVEVRAADQALALASPAAADRQPGKPSTWKRIGVGLVMVALVGVAAAVAGGAPGVPPTYLVPSPARRDRAEAAALPASEQAVPQATSVPSRHLYSGRIFVDRPQGKLRNQELSLLVSFNGERYPFAFRVNES